MKMARDTTMDSNKTRKVDCYNHELCLKFSPTNQHMLVVPQDDA